MRYKSKILLILILIYCSSMFSGCWNYREVNNLAIIMALAMDRDKKNEEYIITVEIVKTQQQQQQQGSIGRTIYESKGKTLFDAVRNLIFETGRRAYWSHCKAIIINHSIAEQDISEVLDWVYRDSELRRDIQVFIYKGDYAGDVIKSSTEMDNTIGYNIHQTIRNKKSVNKYPEAQLGKVVSNLVPEEKSMLIPTIVPETDQGKLRSRVLGSAILKGFKIIGYLSPEETRDILLIRGELDAGVYPILDLLNTGQKMTMEIYNNKVKTKITWDENEKVIKVESKLYVGIGELTGGLDFSEKNTREKMVTDMERNIKEELEKTIKTVQSDYKADVFNFGTKMQIQHTKQRKEVGKKWDEEFSSTPVQVSVRIRLIASAVVSKPIKGGE